VEELEKEVRAMALSLPLLPVLALLVVLPVFILLPRLVDLPLGKAGDYGLKKNLNKTLFGAIKTSSIKSAALRTKIRKGHLPALPMSKVESQKPMCLAWHTKAQCNSNCSCAYNHVTYNAKENTNLATWCVLGFAPPATQG
jgi:hypothetical protein